MAFSPYTKKLLSAVKSYAKNCSNWRVPVRNLMSKQLFYGEFGDPLNVVKFREVAVPPLEPQDVLVRMLAAPLNPADINTIQGITTYLPSLPTVPGDEGVGEVVEIGNKVYVVEPGERVVVSSRMLGTWRYYGIYHERDLHVVSPNLPLAEASILTGAPCMAYRMLKDFKNLKPGDTVIQNAANSSLGQCVIQLCKIWGINTINIVATDCEYDVVKDHLQSLGATTVVTINEAEELTCFDTSLRRPALAINCLGGRFEDILIKILEFRGTIVYYGCALHMPLTKSFLRYDIDFHKFDMADWDLRATTIEKDIMFNDIIQSMVIGKFRAPTYQPVELKNYVQAFRHTVDCEAFTLANYIFDFTLP